jgi:hypothetical protein
LLIGFPLILVGSWFAGKRHEVKPKKNKGSKQSSAVSTETTSPTLALHACFSPTMHRRVAAAQIHLLLLVQDRSGPLPPSPIAVDIVRLSFLHYSKWRTLGLNVGFFYDKVCNRSNITFRPALSCKQGITTLRKILIQYKR